MPAEQVYAQYTDKVGRYREGDRVWVDPDEIDRADYLREVTDEEKEAIREEAEMERSLGQPEPVYVVTFRRNHGKNRAGDRAGLPKSDAEPLIDEGIVTEPDEIQRPEDDVEQTREATEAARRKELESINYNDLRSIVSDIKDEVDDEPESSTGDGLREFVLQHWQTYVSLDDEG